MSPFHRALILALASPLLVVAVAPAVPNYWDPDMNTLGITLQEASVSPGTTYWRLVEGHADDPIEGGGRINIFFRTSNWQANVWWRAFWNGGQVDGQTKASPDWGDFPMSGGNWCPATPPGPFSGRMLGANQASPEPSDTVVGMGLPCNNHWSFRLVFERTTAGGQPTNTPTRTPTRTPTNTPPQATNTPTSTPTDTIPLDDDDDDGLPNVREGHPPAAGQGNRYLADSDGDGLLDGEEDANHNGLQDTGETSPRDGDSDNDGFLDGLEVVVYNSDPLNPSSPGGVLDADGDHLMSFLDPNDNNIDSDGDRFIDDYEAAVNFNGVGSAASVPSLGDVDGNAAVSNLDALLCQSLFLGMADPLVWHTSNSDLNRDGFISNVDALVAQSFFLQTIARLPLALPPDPPPTATPLVTATPTRTPSPTPTNTPNVTILFENHFEEFRSIEWGIGHSLWMPLAYPGDNDSFMWPKNDGGDWGQFYWERSSTSRSGSSFELRIQSPSAMIRGCGAEWWFRGDTALPSNRDVTVAVWTHCTYQGGSEYTDVVIGWAPGNKDIVIIQDYSLHSRRVGEGGWELQTLTFRSHSNPAEGDRILLAFAAQSAQPTISAYFDDLTITVAN